MPVLHGIRRSSFIDGIESSVSEDLLELAGVCGRYRASTYLCVRPRMWPGALNENSLRKQKIDGLGE